MKLMLKAAVLAASLSLVGTAPAYADDPWPVEEGEYVQISMVSVDDGHDLEYMTHMASQWRKGQDFAKAQGWITGYEILANVNKRPGEPDYYLVTRFARFADKAETKKREDAYVAFMKQSVVEAQAGTAARAKYRTLLGSQLLQSMVWTK